MEVESLKLNGHINFVHKNSKNEVVEIRDIKNMVMNVGKAQIALLTTSAAAVPFDAIAIGIGSIKESGVYTTLSSEITTNGGQRRSGTNVTISRTQTTVADDTGQWITTYTFTGGFAVVEAGLFNDGTAGTMLARQGFAPINVISGDTLQVTWKVAFS